MDRDSDTFFELHGNSQTFQESLRNPQDIRELLSILLSVAEDPQVNFENIWDYPTEEGLFKICYTNSCSIVLNDNLDGTIHIYDIRPVGP